jgi:pimeloyl-ACP methyl ester carboxylesterase
MWDDLAPLLPDRFEAVRHDLGGDLRSAMGEPSVLVGASFGGLIALDFAARHPELVTRLVLLAPPLPDHEWSEEMEAYGAEEERLFEAGDLDAVRELNVEFWVGGADAGVRDRVRQMQAETWDKRDSWPDEPESVDLGAVRCPVLVAWGDRENEDFKRIGERLSAELAGARSEVIEGATHLPAMERPEATAACLSSFLGA